MILKFLQSAGLQIDELPSTAHFAFKEIPYKTLVKGMVVADRESGKTFGQLAVKYNLTIRQVKFMCTTK